MTGVQTCALPISTPEQLGQESHFARLRLLDSNRFHDLEAFRAESASYQPVARAVQELLDEGRLSQEAHQTIHDFLGAEGEALLAAATDGDIEASSRLIRELLDRHGIVTRGIVIDIPHLKGLKVLPPETAVTVADIEAFEKMAGVKIGSGDAIFLHTGRWSSSSDKHGGYDITVKVRLPQEFNLDLDTGDGNIRVGSVHYSIDSSTFTLTSWLPVREVEISVMVSPELISFTDSVITGTENCCPSNG